MTNLSRRFIYIVYAPEDPAFMKIGWSNNFRSRLISLQHGNPRRLEVLCVGIGSKTREQEIHKRLSRFHAYGEWFRIEGLAIAKELLLNLPDPLEGAIIETAEPVPPRSRRNYKRDYALS